MPMMLSGPRPPYMAGGPMQPFQPMMLAPQRPPAGFMPPPGFPQAPYPQPPMGPQLAAVGPRAGTITPKAATGSGATTPLHPMQRTLSAGQLLGAPLPPPAFLQPPGVPYMVPPPPGIVLPESLSPGSPGSLRPAAAVAGAPSSRAQSAAHAAHARAGSFGGPAGPMEPLPRAGLQRAGSAGSTSGSLRSSLELGSLGGAPFQPGGASRAPSHAGSRVGSAARKGSAAAAPPPELDEFDNIKVGVALLFYGSARPGAWNVAIVQPLCNSCPPCWQVAVRVRPPNAQELARGDAQALFVNPEDFRQVCLACCVHSVAQHPVSCWKSPAAQPAHPCPQIQLAVPAGYSRNGMPLARNFTFHACLGPTSRQQVWGYEVVSSCYMLHELMQVGLAAGKQNWHLPRVLHRMCCAFVASPSCWMHHWTATTPRCLLTARPAAARRLRWQVS